MKRGTIILTAFPFTDLQGNRVRPAIIISSDKRRGDDVIVAFISSVIYLARLQETDFVLRAEGRSGFSQAGGDARGCLVLSVERGVEAHRRSLTAPPCDLIARAKELQFGD